MSISLLNNLPAMNVRKHLNDANAKYEQSMERITSGKRINHSSDDAAGMAISELIAARVTGIARARLNTLEGLNLVQVAEGGMNEVSNILIRLRELAVQAASDTVGNREREMLEIEAGQLRQEIKRLAETTKYFGASLLNGEGKTFTFQIGADNNEDNRIEYNASKVDIRPETLGVDDILINDADDAREALETIDEAILKLGTPRAELGAIQARLHSIARHLDDEGLSLKSAHSRIVDADLAEETTNAIQNQIRQKAGIAVLSHANTLPTLALRLIES